MIKSMNLLLFLPLLAVGFMPFAFAQSSVINVTSTQPCFLNYTAGLDIMENCGADEDYLQYALLPWQWISGGHFTMIFVAILATFSYIKYHKAAYPIAIGVTMLPISYFAFPDEFVIWALLMTGIAIAILIWYAFVRQTKEW